MQRPARLTKDVVFLGGGHSHALVLRKWGMQPLEHVRLTLINPGPSAPYTGMLPGHIAGHYSRDALEMDLVRLARFAGARLILDRALGLDRAEQEIVLAGGRRIGYDVLSIDIGITSEMPEIPGFAEHGVPAKPLGAFAVAWEAFLPQIREGTRPPSATVIGGGVAGVELALAMHHRLSRLSATLPTVNLVDRGALLRDNTPALRTAMMHELTAKGINVHAPAQVTQITKDRVLLNSGTEFESAFCVGAAGARPQVWLESTGLDLTDGYITLRPSLQSVTDTSIFAAGDCAHLSESPRPKAGVFAVRAAPLLYENLRRVLTNQEPRPFQPQKNYLKLISLGDQAAYAERGSLSVTLKPLSRPLWRWKDRIDRAFMEKFHDLPAMGSDQKGEDLGPPLCGGCGAKVASGTLREALSTLPQAAQPVLETGIGDDAAVYNIGEISQVITTDHLRAVVEDPWVMAQIAACHALGDVWAMGATPHLALATVILPRLDRALQSRSLGEVMEAANMVFTAEGATIAGGHSSMGAEMTLGFTVTGLLERSPITLAGARPGDALILTRAIGSGTLLAAEMAGRARGADIAMLYDSMVTPQGQIARRLAVHANAMTDVTGFGLLGHALGMARASDVELEIDPKLVPFYAGAERLASEGQRSTLYEDNLADLRPNLDGWRDTPQQALLLDPQTCGGLLAAVPEASVAELSIAGVDHHRIGRVIEGNPRLRLI